MRIEQFESMLGKTMQSVTSSSDEMIFTSTDGKVLKFLHYQNCCESVGIEEIIGDLSDLEDSPMLEAEEVSNEDESLTKEADSYESCTWTFYKFATNKGSVTVRWLGTSNGYYSESVSFEEV
jgi:hypothetical protein